jgi:hypothetical protein
VDDNQLAEIEARWAAATPGPWNQYNYPDSFEVVDATDADKAAAYAAPADIAALLAEVKRLRAIEWPGFSYPTKEQTPEWWAVVHDHCRRWMVERRGTREDALAEAERISSDD